MTTGTTSLPRDDGEKGAALIEEYRAIFGGDALREISNRMSNDKKATIRAIQETFIFMQAGNGELLRNPAPLADALRQYIAGQKEKRRLNWTLTGNENTDVGIEDLKFDT